MAMYEIPQRIKHRRGTYTELYQRNEVLLSGEECFETHDADGIEHSPWKCKVGDGATAWNDLEYESTASGGASSADAVSYDNTTSGLAATDVQAAIDELASLGGGDANLPAVMARISLRF